MSKCDNCRLRKESAKAFDIHWHGEDDCPYDKCPVPDFPKTNADRIRSMSDDELAEYLDGVCHDLWQMFVKDPRKMWLDWLREEAANENV